MKLKIPSPISGGLILSYKCAARCRHCIYGCSPDWNADWIEEQDLRQILERLSGRIMPSLFGPKRTGLSYGLHFTGGEPFMNFELLCSAVDMAARLDIPSTFVETNCFWAVNDRTTKEKLKQLKSLGLKGIMISVNPFYLEYVPFERTERAIRAAIDVFGHNVMVYQLEYYKRFTQRGFKDRVPFAEYLKYEDGGHLLRNVEFFMMGRAPYVLKEELKEIMPLSPAVSWFREPCLTPLIRTWHNHFDNYGNYVPGFCGGISLGDCRKLDDLVENGIDLDGLPVLGYVVNNDYKGFFEYAKSLGYEEPDDGYFSKCHLCTDMRKFISGQIDLKELQPREFYQHLE